MTKNEFETRLENIYLKKLGEPNTEAFKEELRIDIDSLLLTAFKEKHLDKLYHSEIRETTTKASKQKDIIDFTIKDEDNNTIYILEWRD